MDVISAALHVSYTLLQRVDEGTAHITGLLLEGRDTVDGLAQLVGLLVSFRRDSKWLMGSSPWPALRPLAREP